MLEGLFGNATVEKVLLFIYNYGEGYAKKIADTFGIPVNAVQQQLIRLENGGILVSQKKGNIRFYYFNPRNYFIKEIKKLLAKEFEIMPQEEKEKYFLKKLIGARFPFFLFQILQISTYKNQILAYSNIRIS